MEFYHFPHRTITETDNYLFTKMNNNPKPYQIQVEIAKKKKTIKAEKIIIATGGRPRVFPGMEPDGKQVITSKEAMILKAPPKKMVIIGAGAIGVEFAYFYNEYGTEVHLIEMMPDILPIEDVDVSKEVEKSFKKSGIKIYKETKVTSIKKLKTKVKVNAKKGDNTQVLNADIVLLSLIHISEPTRPY